MPSSRLAITPTGTERTFPEDRVIVSKTDLRGRITYVNDVFIDVSGYDEAELLGAAHSIVRHPEMPRCIFDLLWTRLEAGHEVFAYLDNLCKNGDHYWVLAHVTPTFDAHGVPIGYHSNRRVPDRRAVAAAEGLYAHLRSAEARETRKQAAVEAGRAALEKVLAQAGTSYDAFVWSL